MIILVPSYIENIYVDEFKVNDKPACSYASIMNNMFECYYPSHI